TPPSPSTSKPCRPRDCETVPKDRSAVKELSNNLRPNGTRKRGAGSMPEVRTGSRPSRTSDRRDLPACAQVPFEQAFDVAERFRLEELRAELPAVRESLGVPPEVFAEVDDRALGVPLERDRVAGVLE